MTGTHGSTQERLDRHLNKKSANGCWPWMGHNHPHAKLTEQQVRKIRADARVQWRIAEDYGVSQGCISAIKSSHRWAHVR